MVSTIGAPVDSATIDAVGTLAGTVQPLVTSTRYDEAGRAVAQTDSAGATTTYDVDLSGNVTATHQPMGQTDSVAHDAHGRLTRRDAVEDQVSVPLQYDNEGKLLHQHEAQQGHDAGVMQGQVTINGTPRMVARALASTTGNSHDLWYANDEMNRQVMIEGAANGNLGDINNLTEGQGHLVTYDHNGNRTSDTCQGQLAGEAGRRQRRDQRARQPAGRVVRKRVRRRFEL